MEDATPSVVDHDVAYLRKLTGQVLELSTAIGRSACAESAKNPEGRATLEEILRANERWREAMATAVHAFDTTNAIIRGALAGEPVGEQPVH